MVPPKIKVLVVDDSALVRKVLTDQLNSDPDIEVIGTASDPYVARDKILQLKPDVLTLDVEMPKMDGLTFLKIMMKHHPMPIIILSSLTQAGSAIAMQALQLGAVGVLGKPSGSYSVGEMGYEMIDQIKAAASARVRNLNINEHAQAEAESEEPQAKPSVSVGQKSRPKAKDSSSPTIYPALVGPKGYSPRQLILLGASTGGTEALKEVLTRMPRNLPGICIVQHIPAHFSKALAGRLNTFCDFEVKEAEDGDIVRSGLALIAPGGYHMHLRWTGSEYKVLLDAKGAMVWHQRPAVDVLFKSAVDAGAAEHSVCGLLTGMGKDGAEGLLQLKEKGAITYAQNEETCVVFGMPRAAMELGAADKMLPLLDFPEALIAGALRKAPR